MSTLVIAFMVLTMLAVAATFAYMVLTALDARYTPRFLHPLQQRFQSHMAPEWLRSQQLDSAPTLQEDALAIFDELFIVDAEPNIDLATAMRTTGMPTLTSESPLPANEVTLFLRAELAIQLGFDLDIRATTANLTHRQYRKLAEYTAFAFDTIETPEAYLGRYGITQIHFVPKHGKFGYHSIGR